MPLVPSLRPAAVVKTFQKLDWDVARQRGSHIIMTKPGHLATLSIPAHSKVAKGILLGPSSKAGITVDSSSMHTTNSYPTAVDPSLATHLFLFL
jgi:predicted RNA binding protein YcfA (HicA-like mRNA interferase family)